MDKLLNFRDLGGIPTADGRQVKYGYFYRCAMPEDASESDVEELKRLGIKLVFDYRNTSEVPENTNGYPYDQIGAQRLAFPMLAGKDKLFQLQNKSNLKRAFAKIGPEDVKQTYRTIPFNNEGYKRMVKALVDGETPFMQHCSAGKDRTGIGSAIVLAILGVSEKEILKDYLRSTQTAQEIEKRASASIPRFLLGWFSKKFGFLFTVQKGYIEAALDEIQKRYGTIENYLLNEFGLGPDKLHLLRDKYCT